MAPGNRQRRGIPGRSEGEADLTLEVVLLLVLGLFMFLFGLLLFGIHAGTFPYTPDSTYGLFLVVVAFQIVTMGKTPFGDVRRTWMVVAAGVLTAALGMLACFIPGLLTDLVRVLVGALLVGGGVSLMLQLLLSREKARLWLRVSGALRRLTVAAAAVYALSVVLGVVTLFPGTTTDPQTAFLLILYGSSIGYLAWCIQRVAREHPAGAAGGSASSESTSGRTDVGQQFWFFREAPLPVSLTILIIVGVLLTLLGVMLFPVSLGLLPFSPDGQLGLLMVINAIQMLALGDTPIGHYRRSRLMVAAGMGFAAVGIFSCIVPGALTGVVQVLIGFLNIAGGVLALSTRFVPMVRGAGGRAARGRAARKAATPAGGGRPAGTQPALNTVLNVVQIVFGVSMLVPGLAPGIVIAGILAVYGVLLFVLVFLTLKAGPVQARPAAPG